MSDFFGRLKSGAGKVAFEAEKMGRLNKARGELERVKGQIQASYAKLGEMYYQQRQSAGVTGPAYDELCQAIASLEQQAEMKNEEIQRIDAEVYTPQGAQPAPQASQSTQASGQKAVSPGYSAPVPGPVVEPVAPVAPAPEPVEAKTKFCPNCGKEQPLEMKFCTDCGTKL